MRLHPENRPNPSARRLADAIVQHLELEERARTLGRRWQADLCAYKARQAHGELTRLLADQIGTREERQRLGLGLHKNTERIQ